MFQRFLTKPSVSSLLLGPRGTGKSTWIATHFAQAPSYDLLNTSEVLRLSKNPSLIYHELAHLPAKSWVVIDEVQKVPSLLDEVHRLMEQKKLRFLLCGSSARKLKRAGVNLLAGRALQTHFFPLTSYEVAFRFKPTDILQYGMLPMSFCSDDPVSYLKTYAEVYLQEEIKQEALTRNIGAFGRFLEVAARQNAQVTNVSDIARDAEIARQTVQGYFDILCDTLMGSWLPTWKLKRATKQVTHPKFYFFDSGVTRALSGRLPYPPAQEDFGPLLETFLLHELKACLAYHKYHYPLYFWRTHDGVEVDFFFETKRNFVALECKAAKTWKPSFHRGLKRLQTEVGVQKVKCYGVYLGERRATFDQLNVFPLMEFLAELWGGKIIL